MGHHHDHDSNPQGLKRAFWINSFILITELIGGIMTGSLALLADAAHNFSDVLAIGLSWWAERWGQKQGDAERTFGYGRVEILVALFNGLSLLAVTIFILYEATIRLLHPMEVNGEGMFWVVLVALAGNGLSAFLLKDETAGNLNRRSAFLHLMADALFSLGVLVAGALVWFFHWTWIDPLFSLVIALFFVRSTWQIIKDAVHVLMEGKPEGLEINQLVQSIKSVEGVLDIHDLHIWSLAAGIGRFC